MSGDITIYTVVAGRYYEDGERNYKVCRPFTYLSDAEAALKEVRDYPWSEIEVTEYSYVSHTILYPKS